MAGGDREVGVDALHPGEGLQHAHGLERHQGDVQPLEGRDRSDAVPEDLPEAPDVGLGHQQLPVHGQEGAAVVGHEHRERRLAHHTQLLQSLGLTPPDLQQPLAATLIALPGHG